MKQSITRWALAGLLTLAALGAVAVVDLGSATAEAAPSTSPFVGSHVGKVPRSIYSSLPIRISDRGQITGSVSGSGRNKEVISGRVSADGSYSFTVSSTYNDYDGERTGGWGTARYEYVGNMSLNADGDIVVPVAIWGTYVWLRQ
jgi:hypothetical protein